ncbi:hypothetical protein AADZ90_012590 [Aestuariibius sp. 2305UL40-4]|uniref:hypothetical protein n=1 Tax=Aestuariibius violaceus TaxID=3234132 RepID=UPI00348AAF26
MSSYHRVCLRLTLRRDTPDALLRALSAAAEGRKPEADDLAALPEVVRDHIRPAEAMEDEFHSAGLRALRFSTDLQPPAREMPGDPLYLLYYEEVFHDDAWANWSMFFLYSLFRHVAADGYIASFEMDEGLLPKIYLKDGPDIVVLHLAPAGGQIWPLFGEASTRLDRERPVEVEAPYRFSIVEAADQADSVSIDDIF